MPAEIGILLGDPIDRIVDAVGYRLAHPLHRVAHPSRAAGATERSRQLNREKIDLAADRLRTLEIRRVLGLVELGSKLHEPGAVLAFRARIENVARVRVTKRPFARIVPSFGSDPSFPQKLGPPLLPERSEMSDVYFLFGMKQQVLEVDETLQRPDDDPCTLVADPREIAFVAKHRFLRRDARRKSCGEVVPWNVSTRIAACEQWAREPVESRRAEGPRRGLAFSRIPRAFLLRALRAKDGVSRAPTRIRPVPHKGPNLSRAT